MEGFEAAARAFTYLVEADLRQSRQARFRDGRCDASAKVVGFACPPDSPLRHSTNFAIEVGCCCCCLRCCRLPSTSRQLPST